jgi:hypothetical protein
MSSRASTTVSPKAVRSELAEQLCSRRLEIEEAIFMRTREASRDTLGDHDARYIAGLRRAVASLVEYAIKAIEEGEEPSTPIPSVVTEQACLAARSGVGLLTVSRRYMTGYQVLVDFVMDEAGQFPSHAVRHVLAPLTSRLDRLMDVAASAYEEEVERLRRSPERRRAQRVERLLAGESVDTDDLGYDFERNWHIAAIATGCDAGVAIRFIARALDRRVLLVERDTGTVWAWLGGQQCIPASEIERVIKSSPLREVTLAVGEPQLGLEGWRLTYSQAQAALSIAQRRPQPLTRYFEVGLAALALQDERQARQLLSVYLGCLCEKEGSSQVLRQTLRAYFAADRVAKAAGKSLGVHRRTVDKRLAKAEALLDYDLRSWSAELELSLRIFELLEGHG